MSEQEARDAYEYEQSVREWNSKFRTPPVCTDKWDKSDWDRWEEGRKPLPPFEEWYKAQQDNA